MNRIFTKSLGLALISSAFLTASAAPGAQTVPDLTSFRYKAKHGSAFKSDRADRIVKTNSLMYPLSAPAFAPEETEFAPTHTFGPANVVGDLDGPEGEAWYYTASYEYEVIPPDYDNYIWYTDYILLSYRFDIYDQNAEFVGSIQDKMNYADDEKRAVYYDLTPFVSRNFFNTSDDLELAVGLAVNSTTPGINHYRTLVYSIGGEKDPDGNDKPFMTYPELITDVAEGPKSADGRDNFYIAFTYDFTAPASAEGADGSEVDSFWDYLTRRSMTVSIMGRAEGDKEPVVIHDETIPLLNLPGDQESTPFMFNFDHDGQLWYMFNYLEKPLWKRYDDPMYAEMTQRPDNYLQVFLYSLEGEKMNLRQKTLIAAPKDEADEWAVASFYSVGDMRYKQDVVFEGFGQPEGKADFYVTRTNYTPSSDSSTQSFYAYDWEGKKIHTYAEYCASTLSLSDLPGFEPQQMFVQAVGGAYQMTFIDLYSAKEAFSTSNYYYIGDLDEGEYIMANVDRTPVGDSYKYAFEMTYPVEIDDETMLRVLWTNADGSFDRIDMVNAGENILYAMFYISNESLQPGVFNEDDELEYLYMVKVGVPGNGTDEEVRVSQPVSDADPEGKTLLAVGTGDKGALGGVVPYLYGEKKHLNIYFRVPNATTDMAAVSMDIYDLPLGTTGIGETFAAAKGSLKVEGSTVSAAGAIKVYTPAGAQVAAGAGSLTLAELPKGLYIVEADGESLKVAVK